MIGGKHGLNLHFPSYEWSWLSFHVWHPFIFFCKVSVLIYFINFSVRSLYYLFEKALYILGRLVPYLWFELQIYSLSFLSPLLDLWCLSDTKSFDFYIVQFINLSLMAPGFLIAVRKVFLTLRLSRSCTMFSPSTFIVSFFTFKFLIHLKYNLV